MAYPEPVYKPQRTQERQDSEGAGSVMGGPSTVQDIQAFLPRRRAHPSLSSWREQRPPRSLLLMPAPGTEHFCRGLMHSNRRDPFLEPGLESTRVESEQVGSSEHLPHHFFLSSPKVLRQQPHTSPGYVPSLWKRKQGLRLRTLGVRWIPTELHVLRPPSYYEHLAEPRGEGF